MAKSASSRQSDNKTCTHCEARYRGWSASKYCTARCRIVANSAPNENGCWIWRRRTSPLGYGKLNFNTKTVIAPRAAFEAWSGEIPSGMQVCHRCDNPQCVNPEHLFLGTCADNNRDCVTKGRQARGERAGSAKLSESQVREILLSQDATKTLARRFNLAPATIRSIRDGRTWRHIERPAA